ncbi:exodeoxyribonuclease V subunit alpha [Aquipuribacter sp. MA13-6]|uniref:exodeoxyribonuclease V subunit alpha n=1 Tax=unclassified Aquipuribacter TaxID=2635084 RepID=UPI003EECBE6E
MPAGPYSPDLALRAHGLLRAFNDAGVLSAADVHVAGRLGALLGEDDETVLLAVALTVRSTRGGSVVVDLATAADLIAPDADEAGPGGPDPIDLPWPERDAWLPRVAASPLVSGYAAPLAMRGSRLWLSRYDVQEQQVVDELRRRTATLPDDLDPDLLRSGLERLFPRAGDADQRLGAAVCASSRVSVLAGGPGTGKTTTVSRVLALLREQDPTSRIALAAPTGKAAARLEEAVRSSTARFSDPGDRDRVGELVGVTLHRLLGWQPGTRSRFRHHAGNRLPYEVVVVDEASMVPLTMMARLLEALRDGTRLVLVGDPDQLASVEAGAVLGDLVDRTALGRRTAAMTDALDTVLPGHGSTTAPGSPAARLRDGIASLTVNHRFAAGSAIGALSDAVRAGDADGAVALLQGGGEGVELVEVADDAPLTETLLAPVREDVARWGADLRRTASAGDAVGALRALDEHRLLCAHRRGPRGVQHWEWLATRWLDDLDDLGEHRGDGYRPGQPLLVTTNDYEVGLFNGDTGVVVAGPAGSGGGLRAVFARGGEPASIPLVRLGSVRPVHAMTVHRSQGSQFGRVTVVLPTAESPLATRETLYTAITRAVSQVRVIGSVEAFAAAVARPAARATGLRERLGA